MRRSMNVILTIVVICSLVLTAQHSVLAQVKSKQNFQSNTRKTKKKAQVSGVERYRAIVQNNLFMPLGSGDEVKQSEFILAGILGNSAFIQIEGSNESFYVMEGQSFGNDAKLVQVGEDRVTIIHEGSKKELALVGGTPSDEGGKGGETRQSQGSPGKSGGKVGSANRSGEKRGSASGKQEGGKGGDDGEWARKMSRGELTKVREDIGTYIEGLEKKGVTDPEAYSGAYEKMEMVERAIAEKGED